MDKRSFGKAAQPEALEQADPIPSQTRGIGRSAQRRLRVSALKGAAGKTSSARPASLRERTHDVISDTDMRYVGADSRHDTGDLVTKHRWRRSDIVSGEQQVGVTQSGRLHLDENFAPNRRGDVHILEVEPATECVYYKRLHESLLAENC
jgi:hypothetical protein